MKAKSNINEIMNKIVKDFLVLSLLSVLGIIIYGWQKENGDINAGSMYGIIELPFLSILFISLCFIEVVKYHLKVKQIWIGNFAPIIFLFLCLWLSTSNSFILIFNIVIVIVYQHIKTFIS
jgi:hypothetical protein